MESKMTVVKKGDNFPLRAMPEETLNNKILELSEWLTRLLSIKPDDSNVDKLEVLLPMIKDSCWSMTISEIQKAFTMYVQNKLPLQPKSNYLDAILFNQVISAYKEQLPKPKPKELPGHNLSDEEKENLIYTGCVSCFDEWNQDGRVLPGYTWVYDHLDELNLFSFDRLEKMEALKKAKSILNGAALRNPDKIKRRQLQSQLESKDSPQAVNEAKRILLGDFFKGLKSEKKHIKDII